MKLKKLVSCLVLLTPCATGFAGTMGAESREAGWAFGAKALYLESFTTDTQLSNYTTISTISKVGDLSWNKIRPNWDWGFALEGTYYFQKSHDVTLNWYRLHTNSVQNLSQMPSAIPALGTALPINYEIQYAPDWDAANIEVGQTINFDEFGRFRFHGGAQYSRIASTVGATAIDKVPAVSSMTSTSGSVTYNGFGPRLGIDMLLNLSSLTSKLGGFTLYGKGATALLLGPQSFHNYLRNGNGLTSTSNSQTQIVPEFEGKLGAQYSLSLAKGSLDFDLGWMWNAYLNARFGANSYSALSTAPTQLTPGNIPTASTFSLQGLYFGLKWTQDV